jgi:AcrR family transcriptional regulator
MGTGCTRGSVGYKVYQQSASGTRCTHCRVPYMAETARQSDTVAARRAGGPVGQREQRRQRIIEAAAVAIDRYGTGAALGVVADQAGVPRPHVYRHFERRDDLDLEVARHAARQLSAWIRPALSARGTPPAIIRGIISKVLAWAMQHPNLYRFRARLGPSAAVPEFMNATAAYMHANGHGAVPPAQAVASIIGMVDASVLWWLDNTTQLDADQLIERLAAQVWLVLTDVMTGLGRPVSADDEWTPPEE